MAKNLLVIGLTITAANALAQMPVDGAHYPVGLNGSKAGIPDSPGVYFRDDNLFYFADRPGNVNTFIYMQAPQLTWLTGWKILGANIGADVMVPIIYKQVDFGATGIDTDPGGGFPEATGASSHNQFGIGDIKIEPLLLAWNWDQWDLMAAGGVWAPSGHFDAGRPDNLGDGQWSPMVSLGAVWYPDEAKTWAISILHHYEFNCKQSDFTTPAGPNGGFPEAQQNGKVSCSTYTLEYAVSKTIFDHTDVGLAGYYQQQFSDDNAASNPTKDSDVAGIGPEVSVMIPKWDLSLSLRYAYEFTAHDRPQGDTIDLSVTKKF